MSEDQLELPEFLRKKEEGSGPKPISPAQLSYAQSLCRKRRAPEGFQELLEEEIKNLTSSEARHYISSILLMPPTDKAAFRGVHRSDIDEGCYLVDIQGKKGTYEFWCRVRQDKGITRVYRLAGSPGALASTPVHRIELVHQILAAIAFDAAGARARFIQELGCCGRCFSPLTVELSRERGYGPICWEKL